MARLRPVPANASGMNLLIETRLSGPLPAKAVSLSTEQNIPLGASKKDPYAPQKLFSNSDFTASTTVQ